MNIDWERISEGFIRLIQYRSRTTFLPIRAELWEEIIYATFKRQGLVVDWKVGDHAKGVDLVIHGEGAAELKISAKGGSIKRNGEVHISSYRLTRFQTLEDKLKFLKDNADKLDIYLSCAREETAEIVRYRILKMPASALVPPHLLTPQNWTETVQGWILSPDDTGLAAKIVKSMSHQLWYVLPNDYAQLVELGNVEINQETRGLELLKKA